MGRNTLLFLCQNASKGHKAPVSGCLKARKTGLVNVALLVGDVDRRQIGLDRIEGKPPKNLMVGVYFARITRNALFGPTPINKEIDAT